MKGDPLETLKNLRKMSHEVEKKLAQKMFWSWAGLEPILLGRPQNLPKIRSRRSYISVAVSGSQLIKSVTSLVLKKEMSLL